MVNTRSSSSSASRRRPCRSANAAIVSFMPPSSCDHVPSRRGDVGPMVEPVARDRRVHRADLGGQPLGRDVEVAKGLRDVADLVAADVLHVGREIAAGQRPRAPGHLGERSRDRPPQDQRQRSDDGQHDQRDGDDAIPSRDCRVEVARDRALQLAAGFAGDAPQVRDACARRGEPFGLRRPRDDPRPGARAGSERTSVTCVPAGVNSDAARSVVSRLPALARKSSSLAASSGAQRLARPAARSRPRGVSRAATSRRSRSAGSMAASIATYASAGFRTEAVGRWRPESRVRTRSSTSRTINP